MVGGNELQNGLVQQAVAGQDAGFFEGDRLAASGGHLPAGLLDEQAAGGEIPGSELVLEEGAEAPQANIRQVKCGGAHAPHAVNIPPQEIGHGGQGRLHHGASIVIVAEADESLLEAHVVDDLRTLAVVKSALAAPAVNQSS